jgi:hypothetical protein
MLQQPGNVLTIWLLVELMLCCEMSNGKREQALADSLCQFLWTHTAHCRFHLPLPLGICVAKYALYQNYRGTAKE